MIEFLSRLCLNTGCLIISILGVSVFAFLLFGPLLLSIHWDSYWMLLAYFPLFALVIIFFEED